MQPRRSDVAFADIFGRPSAPAPQHRSSAQPPLPPLAQTPPSTYSQQFGGYPSRTGGGGGQRVVSGGSYAAPGLAQGLPQQQQGQQQRGSYYANNEAVYSTYHQQPYAHSNQQQPARSQYSNTPGNQTQSPDLVGQANWHQQQQHQSAYPTHAAYAPPSSSSINHYPRQSYTPSLASGPETASTSASTASSHYSPRSSVSSPPSSTSYNTTQPSQSQPQPHRSTSPAISVASSMAPGGRYSGPPRLPEFSPLVDDFYGFESERFDNGPPPNGSASGNGNGNGAGRMKGTENSFVRLEEEQESGLGQGREEDDGFDQFGPTSNYQYYEPSLYSPSPSVPSSQDPVANPLKHSRRNSGESDFASVSSIYPSDARPLLALNPSLTSVPSLASNNYPIASPYPYRPPAHLQSQSRRRSSESVHVLPTQPKVNPNPAGDRAFSFSGGSERPDLLGGGGIRPSSVNSGPPPGTSSPSLIANANPTSNSLAARRSPVVYPALLSRVAEAFKTRVSVSERVKDGLVYSDAFDGRDAVDKIAYIIKTTDRNLALLLGRALDAQKFFHDVTYDHRLRDSQIELYQFRERLGGGFLSSEDLIPAAGGGGGRGAVGAGDRGAEVGSGEEDELPSGVFTLLTDCYSPTCTRDRLCYSIACPRRLEQQARLNLKPKPGLQRSVSSESLGDLREPGELWIYSVPQDVADSTSDSEKKRQEALNEVFYTERDFVRDMEYLRDSWIKPLRTTNIIPESRREDFITQVFWNVLEILAVNVRLAEMLNKRQKQSHVVEKVGDIFLEMVPHFGPFVKYGAHQLYGKYEFEKEKGSNPAFAKFVDETERLAESRKLELNGYLTKPTTRLARYPLLLEACLKNTPDDNPDKIMLPKVVKLVREFLNKVNIETGKSENRFNLAQLDQQLVFKNGEAVDLRLRDEEREMIFKGPLKKRGGTQSESAELQVFLFDHAILMVKQKGKNEQYKVYRKPIPLELLVVAPLDDTPSARAGTARPRSLVSRGSNARYLANPPPGIDKNSKQGFAMTFIHLGRRGYQITVWSASWAGRKKWLEKIEARQEELRERSLVFDTVLISSGFFAGTNRVTCAAPFENGSRIVYGTDNGVYLSDLRQKNKAPVKVISVPNVTQLDVLDDQGILIVLADKAVQTFFVDNLDPGDAVGAAKRARKISSHATFFKAGQCLGRTLVCVVKSGSVSSTIKTLEPIDQIRGKKQPTIRKFLQGSNESLRVFKEFYIPTESSSVHFLKSKLCVGCTKGFEIVDLETLDTQGLLDPADSSLDFVQKRENARPVAIYRIEGEFLLCYDEFAFYVNKNGWRAKSNWIIQWEGAPTAFALHYPYVLAFEPTFIEVRHVESGALMQIIPGNNFRCLYADSPASSSNQPLYLPPPPPNPNQYGYAPSGHPSIRGPQQVQIHGSEIILADYDRISKLVLAS